MWPCIGNANGERSQPGNAAKNPELRLDLDTTWSARAVVRDSAYGACACDGYIVRDEHHVGTGINATL